MHLPILIIMTCHASYIQGRYNMIDRTVESAGTLTQAKGEQVGFTAFSPLEQGMLTDRYINGIPEDSQSC